MIEINNKRLYANLTLLLASAIWGFAFVAQRVGSQYIGAFLFNGIRFALGSISLLPLIFFVNKKKERNTRSEIKDAIKDLILPGVLIGTILFTGSSLQQVGLTYTTAGKASFITGLYVVLVPVIGIFLRHKIDKESWIGVGLAVIGLYLLSINENLSISYGDSLEVIGSLFWTFHILSIDYFSKKIDPIKLSCIQFATCSLLSLISSLMFENITLCSISNAIIPILYGGFLSVGVAFTLQVVGQKNAKPSHAAIILSMESVFGALGGALILGETMSMRGYLGCLLIFSGIIISQIKFTPKIDKQNIT